MPALVLSRILTVLLVLPLNLQESARRQAQAVLDIVENFLSRCEAGETIEQPKFAAGEAVRAVWKVRRFPLSG